MGQTNYSLGHEAEVHAAKYLKQLGYKIKDLNWKTRICEIDIIAVKEKTIYFVEVKHRSSSYQGGGLDYITPTKLNQMEFAAKCWVQENKYRGSYELAAIEVAGSDFTITDFIPALS